MANAANLLAGITGAGANGLTFAQFAPFGTPNPALSAVAGTAGVQTVTVTGTPTGGTFTLTWNGKTTAAIAYNATAAAVQAAVNALAGGSTVTSSGGPLPTTAVVLTFPAIVPQVLMTATSSLTGGSTPTVAVANTTAGVQSTNGATVAVPAAFKDVGYVDQAGMTIKVNTSSADIKGYGTTAVLRTIISEQKRTLDVKFLETNATAVAVFNSLPLGSVTVDASGYLSVTQGVPQVTAYSAVFNVSDGSNFARFFLPNIQNISPGDLNVSAGQIIDRPASFTVYPDALGNTLYEYYVVANLAT